MAKKATTATRKNRPDATLRNVRASNRRWRLLTTRVEALERRVNALDDRTASLVRLGSGAGQP